MKALFLLLALFCSTALAENQKGDRQPLTDEQVATALIKDSISTYPGNCPCPYNLASNGSKCGKRSAYSRGGGYAPLCYRNDVTKDMIDKYRLQSR